MAAAQEEVERKRNKFAFEEKISNHYLVLGNALMNHGKLRDAEAAFDKALERNPHNIKASMGSFKANILAVSAENQHDPTVIHTRLSIFRSAQGEDPHMHAVIGMLYLEQGDLEAAKKSFDFAIKINDQISFGIHLSSVF